MVSIGSNAYSLLLALGQLSLLLTWGHVITLGSPSLVCPLREPLIPMYPSLADGHASAFYSRDWLLGSLSV